MTEEYWTAVAMREQGGSFVRKLGELFAMADDSNREIIKRSWPEYWSEYRKIGAILKAADDAKEQA